MTAYRPGRTVSMLEISSSWQDAFSSSKPVRIKWGEQTQSLSTWRDVLVWVSREVWRQRTDQFDLALNIRGTKRPYFARSERELRNPLPIPGTPYFVEGQVSSWGAAHFASRLLAAFDFDPREVAVEVRFPARA
jgi:hypothetical protein